MVDQPGAIPLSRVVVDASIRQAVDRVLASGTFINGPEVVAFEKEFAEFCGSDLGVATSNGTTAIILALQALGVGPGDEVLCPSHSFIATATPVSLLGATPVFVDIDDETMTIDPSAAAALVTDKTVGIIAVHLYGQPADLDPLQELAEERGLFVLEDACQAHGATYKGRTVGSLADIACFSFYPSKNLTVGGDGGMIVSDRDELIDAARALRNHGRAPGDKYRHTRLGSNSRLSEIQAAIGRAGLSHLPKWSKQRQAIAARYSKALAGHAQVRPPTAAAYAGHVYHMYVVRSSRRESLQSHLMQRKIATGIHYPIPIHQQPIYVDTPPRAPLPRTEATARQVLSLPMFPELSDSDVATVCEGLSTFS